MKKFVLLIIYLFSVRNPYIWVKENVSVYKLVRAYYFHRTIVCKKYNISDTDFENALISYAAHALIADVKHFGSYDASILKVYKDLNYEKIKNISIRLVKEVPTPYITVSNFDTAIKSANSPKHLRKILMALKNN